MASKKNKRLHYSSLSVLLTVVVLAVLVVVNVIISALTTRNNWYLDMTQNDLFTVSDSTITLLEDLQGNYEILFCEPLDRVSTDTDSMLIYNCARDLSEKLDNVSVEYLDVVTYPSLAAQYKRSTSENVNTTDVIVRNMDSEGKTINFRKYAQSDFYVTDSESGQTTAFRGEQRFANALLQLGGENRPIAAFTTGHGERVPQALSDLFEDVGYEVQTVDLTQDTLAEETSVVVIYDPKFDFHGAFDAAGNEIAVLDEYMMNYGNLMVFMGAQTPDCPQLDEYLEEWGIVYGEATVRDASSAVSTDGMDLIASLADDGELGSSVTQDMKALDSQPITIVPAARPLYQPYDDKNARDTSSVLTTTPSAECIAGDGSVTTGQVDQMLLSRETTVTNDGNLYSYVLACGSTSFCDDEDLSKNAYGNRDIIYSLMNIFNKDQTAVSIDYKEFDASTLTVSTAQARTWLIVTAVVIPVAILICGTVVWVRRKRL